MTPISDCTILDSHEEGDPCPVHNKPHRKIYTFGSTMTGDWSVTAGPVIGARPGPAGHDGGRDGGAGWLGVEGTT